MTQGVKATFDYLDARLNKSDPEDMAERNDNPIGIELRYIRLLLSALITLSCAYAFAQPARDLLIINARLVDGTGASARHTSIGISDGAIVSLDEQADAGANVLDVSGATVLPGLIDSHVHLQSVPGAVFRKDDAQTRRRLLRHHLRAYVACGVTTVLDTAIASAALREVQEYLADGGIGPRVMALGPTFHKPGGYLDGDSLSDYWGPRWRSTGSREDVIALFEEYDGIPGIVGVKVPIAFGVGRSLIDVWETHSPEMREVIKVESAKRNQPIYVHATVQRERDIALELGAHAIVHLGFFDTLPSQRFIRRMKEQGTYIATTTSLLDVMGMRFHLDRLDDPLVQMTVPKVEIETTRNDVAWDGFVTTLAHSTFPWLPRSIAGFLGNLFMTDNMVNDEFDATNRALLTLHDAGIPIVVATDSGSWPHFLNLFHGPTTLREMELLANAGMDLSDVIAAATSVPAKMMGIDHLVGTVEIGKRADLIVVSGDPLEDITALRKLLWVIKDGEARRPRDWMRNLDSASGDADTPAR